MSLTKCKPKRYYRWVGGQKTVKKGQYLRDFNHLEHIHKAGKCKIVRQRNGWKTNPFLRKLQIFGSCKNAQHRFEKDFQNIAMSYDNTITAES